MWDDEDDYYDNEDNSTRIVQLEPRRGSSMGRVTSTGEEIRVSKMELTHLVNSINWLRRNGIKCYLHA